MSKFSKYLYLTDDAAKQNINIAYTMMDPYLDRIVCLLKDSNPNFAYKEFKELEHSNCNIYTLELPKKIEEKRLQDLEKHESRWLSNDTDFSLRRYATTSIIEKNVISGIIGVAFGIIIGFIPLVQNEYVSSLRAMGLIDYLILFGLGVGIGNLNEAISKIWEKPKDTEEK